MLKIFLKSKSELEELMKANEQEKEVMISNYYINSLNEKVLNYLKELDQPFVLVNVKYLEKININTSELLTHMRNSGFVFYQAPADAFLDEHTVYSVYNPPNEECISVKNYILKKNNGDFVVWGF